MKMEDVWRKLNAELDKQKMAFLENKELLRSNINITVKKKIIETHIFSVLAYGSETWTLIEEAKRRINAFEMWCYRRMLKISWRRFMSNNKVLEMVGEDRYFMKKIVERKFEFAGHILRGSMWKADDEGFGREDWRKTRSGKTTHNVAGWHKEMERRKKIWTTQEKSWGEKHLEDHENQPSDRRRHKWLIELNICSCLTKSDTLECIISSCK